MSQIYILESWEEISPLGSWTLSAARERSVDGPSPPPASDRAMWPHSLSHNWRTPGKPASISLDLPRNSRASIPSHSPCRRSGGGSAPPSVYKVGFQLHGIETSSLGASEDLGALLESAQQEGESHWEEALGRAGEGQL